MNLLRIFISSPGDVKEERERACQVVQGLQRRYAGVFLLKPVLWEELPLQADMSFQQGIDLVLSKDKGIDIAVFILWSRLGSPLGARIRKADGSEYRSGTEREFDLMLEARRQSGGQRPALLAYTRQDEASFEERLRNTGTEEKEDIIAQKKLVERFIQEEFHDGGSGHNVRAYHSFDRPQTFSRRLRAHLVELLDELAGDAVAQVVWDIDTQGPPFMGLEAFGPEQAAVFCGRDAEVLEARRALTARAREGCAFLLLSGASGSGKSSLAKAGLLPAIAEHELDETIAEWRALSVTPSELGDEPLGGLVTRLAEPGLLPELRAEGRELADVAGLLASDPERAVKLLLKPAVAEASAKRKGGVRLLLLLDQLEELFTLQQGRVARGDGAAASPPPGSDAPEQREAFLAAVEALARSGMVWVVATLRGDFLGDAQRSAVLARLLAGGGLLPVAAPDTDALRHIIEEPARFAGLRFEERDGRRLGDRILADAARHADLLPLVEHVLRELYDQRDARGTLTWAAYEALGGVEGALARRADAALASLPPTVQTALPQVLKRLVSLSEARGGGAEDGAERLIRQRVALDRFAPDTPARTLVDAFIVARLFTAGDGGLGGGGEGQAGTVTVAHEALLRVWPTAAAWAEQNRDLLRTRARVAARMGESARIAEGDPLLEVARLDLGRDPDAFTHEQAAYIQSSHQAAEAARRRRETLRRRVITGLAALTLVALAGAGWAWNSNRVANKVGSNLKLTQAAEHLMDDDPYNALAWAGSALADDPSYPLSHGVVYSLLSHGGFVMPSYLKSLTNSSGVMVVPDRNLGKGLTFGIDSSLSVWDLATGTKLAEVLSDSGELLMGDFTSDGTGVHAWSNKDMMFRIWNGLPTGPPARSFELPLSVRWQLHSADDGPMVGLNHGVIRDLMEESSGFTSQFLEQEEVPRVFFGTLDGFMKWRDDEDTQAWDEEIRADVAVFSADGSVTVTGGPDGVVRFWDIKGRRMISEHTMRGAIQSLKVARDGTWCLAASAGGEWKLIAIETGESRFQWQVENAQQKNVSLLTLTTDESRVAAYLNGPDPWVQIWDRQSGQRLFYHNFGEAPLELTFSADGERLFCGRDWLGFTFLDVAAGHPETTVTINRYANKRAFWSEPLRKVILIDASNTLRAYPDEAPPGGCFFLPGNEPVWKVRFSSDGRLLLVVRDQTHQVWDTATWLPRHQPVEHEREIWGDGSGFADGGAAVVLADKAGIHSRWSGDDGSELADGGGEQEAGSLGVSSVSANGRYQVRCVAILGGVLQDLLSANALPTAVDAIALRSKIRSRIEVVNLDSGEPGWSRELLGQFYHASVSDDSRVAVMLGSRGGTTMEALVITAHGEPQALPLDRLGDTVVVSLQGRYAAIDQGKTGALLVGLNPLRRIAHLRHYDKVNAMVFAPDESWVATVSADGTACLWRCKDGRPVAPPMQHRNGAAIYAAAVSPDGAWLATAGADHAVRVWEASSGRQASAPLESGDEVNDVAFSPDGRWIAAGGDDGSVRVWPWLPAAEMIAPPWILELAGLLSERILDRYGVERPVESWSRDQLRKWRKQEGLHTAWEAILDNYLVEPAQQRVVAQHPMTVAEDQLRQAICRLRMGDHNSAVHLTRMALRRDPKVSVPAELESVRRLLAGEPIESSSIDLPPGQYHGGAGRKAGEPMESAGGIRLRWCPPASFMMGSPPDSPGRGGMETWRRVWLTHGFWMGETEVTQGQWRALMDQTQEELAADMLADETTRLQKNNLPHTLRSYWSLSADAQTDKICGILDDVNPVIWVSRVQAEAFCEKLTERERKAGLLPNGWSYRLPTEAEWEHACRAGATGSLGEGHLVSDPNSLNAPELEELAWYGGNSCRDYPAQPGWSSAAWEGKAWPGDEAGHRAVGTKQPNAWGLHDMLGNVHEWTACSLNDVLHLRRVNPFYHDVTGESRAVVRGGSWMSRASDCRHSSRFAEPSAQRSMAIGFRVVLAMDESQPKEE